MDSQQAHLQAWQQQQQDQWAQQQLQANQALEWEVLQRARRDEESRANHWSSSTPNVPQANNAISGRASVSSNHASGDTLRSRLAENLEWLLQWWLFTVLGRLAWGLTGMQVFGIRAYEPELQLWNFIWRLLATS